MRRGEARVVLGPRSALFAPVADLGLIVVDEEQDTSYKQELAPRYNARDLALVRGRATPAPRPSWSPPPRASKAATTPSAGSWSCCASPSAPARATLPEGILVDLRGGGRLAPARGGPLLRAPARGDPPGARGRRPGHPPAQPPRLRADPPLPRLRRGLALRGLRPAAHLPPARPPAGLPLLRLDAPGAPSVCPNCKEEALEAIGAGTERVEEDFKELFPDVTVDVLDRDTARRPGGPAAVLERFDRGEVQVLIGTQMVSKGHHFPNVALTAVLAADAYLELPGFPGRGAHLQPARAGGGPGGEGRAPRPGGDPDLPSGPLRHPGRPARGRRRLRPRGAPLPPGLPLSAVHAAWCSSWSATRTATARKASSPSSPPTSPRTPSPRAVRLSGPAPAPLERLRGEWRFQLLVRSADGRGLHRMLEEVLPKNPGYDLVIDVDRSSCSEKGPKDCKDDKDEKTDSLHPWSLMSLQSFESFPVSRRSPEGAASE